MTVFIPSSVKSFLKRCFGKGFVKISAIISSVATYLKKRRSIMYSLANEVVANIDAHGRTGDIHRILCRFKSSLIVFMNLRLVPLEVFPHLRVTFEAKMLLEWPH